MAPEIIKSIVDAFYEGKSLTCEHVEVRAAFESGEVIVLFDGNYVAHRFLCLGKQGKLQVRPGNKEEDCRLILDSICERWGWGITTEWELQRPHSNQKFLIGFPSLMSFQKEDWSQLPSNKAAYRHQQATVAMKETQKAKKAKFPAKAKAKFAAKAKYKPAKAKNVLVLDDPGF